MANLPNRQDLFAVGRRSIRTAAAAGLTRINPNIVDVAGSDVNLMIGSSSLMGEAIVTAFVTCVRDLFVVTANDAGLDKVAFDRYGLVRFPSNPATVPLKVARPTFAAGGGTVNAGTIVQTPQGTQFSTDIDLVFGATDLTKTVSGTALVTGPDGNVPAGAITAFVNAPFDATMTVTNLTGAAGGADVEDDPSFRGRIKGFFRTIRRGVLGAIEFAALDVDGVSVATAFEIQNPTSGFPAAVVQLIIGDANGNASPDMIQAVIDNLLTFRAGGIAVTVSAGNIAYEQVVWQGLVYDAGIDTVGAQNDIRAVTVAVSQFLNPGDELERALMIAAAKAVPGVHVNAQALLAPAGDIIPTNNNTMIRIRPQDVTFI